MKYIQGQNRNRAFIFPVSFIASIEPDNEIRIIDALVSSLPLKEYCFRLDYGENGLPTLLSVGFAHSGNTTQKTKIFHLRTKIFRIFGKVIGRTDVMSNLKKTNLTY